MLGQDEARKTDVLKICPRLLVKEINYDKDVPQRLLRMDDFMNACIAKRKNKYTKRVA
jgi:hypothetical protein